MRARAARFADWAPLVGALLVVAADRPPRIAAAGLLALAVVLLWRLRRSLARGTRLGLGAAIALQAMALAGPLLSRADGSRAAGALDARLDEVEARTLRLASRLRDAAVEVATRPEARSALRGDRAALSQVFARLEALRGPDREAPALALYTTGLLPLAWAGATGDRRVFSGFVAERSEVFVLAGSVTTTLIASAPVRGPDGGLDGIATAELPVSVRRHIRNAFLRDFDLLAGSRGDVELHYVDVGDEGPRALPASPGRLTRDRPLRAPDGRLLAVARALEPPGEGVRPWPLRRPLLALALSLALAAWLAGPGTSPARLALGLSALRLVLLVFGPAAPDLPSPLLSPEAYASPWLGPLLRSPLDLLLTVAWSLGLLLLLLAPLTARQPAVAGDGLRGWAADLLAVPLLGLCYAWVGDTVANSSLDVEAIAAVPRSAAHLALQLGLLGILALGVCLIAALNAWAGPLPSSWHGRGLRLARWALLGAVAYRFWPRGLIGLPLVPAIGCFVLGSLLGGESGRLARRLRHASDEARAALFLCAVALLAALLHPSLAHFAEKSLRHRIERDQAPLVLRQPEWRRYVLEQTQHRIDDLRVLEDEPAAPRPPRLGELAFSVWSATDLPASGFSSAIEIQDSTGGVLSRFALGLPVPGAPPGLPASVTWAMSRDTLPFASSERRVLHARRRLGYHGEVHGAIHVYVGDDMSSLPLATGRDPYSVLFRSASASAERDGRVELLVWSWERALIFSTFDRPPTLEPALVERLRGSPAGFWTTLAAADGRRDMFLFSDAQSIYALGYPRRSPGRVAADLVEATSGLVLAALAGVVALLLLRTALRRPTLSLPSLARLVASHFSLRLFVAFVAVAILPVVVLEFVVRGFVTDRLSHEADDQALEMAAVARKAVEDFAFFQKGEAPGQEPVTDAALVWIASLIRNELDVFERGRLLASSKRELYASGLLSPRVSGSVFRALALEGRSAVLRTERIGDFSYRAISVPARIGPGEPAILSIPLALRERDVQAVFEDLDRAIRLASALFLVAAAGLALHMARRISGPLRELTLATQRVARGDLAARVETRARDELKTLVDSFNQMAGDLERQRCDLERSNRVAAWAEMARQVAHEVKNPLTPIQLSAEHLRRVYGDPSLDFEATLEACTETILRQVRGLREIVTEFSAFARPPAAQPAPLELGPVLRAVTQPYAGVLPPGVTLTLDLDGGVPPVLADRRLIERAVVNLLENALQAVGEAGSVILRLRHEPSEGRAIVEVEDTGPGLDPELGPRVFEPFFSTKTGGSGLGLALVRKIAEDHGGGATLQSQPGRTRAALWLPLARRSGPGAPTGP